MAKAYTFSANGGFVPVDALTADTSISIASGAFAADTNGITMGADKDITLSGGGEILGLPSTPSASDAAASMAYVQSYADSVASGLDVKQSVKVATTADLSAVYDNGTSGVGATLTASGNGALSVDSVALSANDRVLVKNQTNAEENGIYLVSDAGGVAAPFVLTRATDADTGGASGELTPGAFCFVTEGTAYADTGWVLSSPDTAITMGTTELAFTQFSSAGDISAGAGLTKTGSTIDVVSANTGIVVNADNIELSLASNSGLEISSGLKIDLDSSSGLALGAGGIKFDLGVLSNGAGSFAADYSPLDQIAYYDASASATKRVDLGSLVTEFAGLGLSATSGVLALDLSELTEKGTPTSTDMVALMDDADNSSKLVSMANLAGILADELDGAGLVTNAGALEVNVDDVTIEIASDVVQVKAGGIGSTELASGAVIASKLVLLSSVSSLVSAGALSSPSGKAAYVVQASGKVAASANSEAGMRVCGLFANEANITGADEDVDLHCVDGVHLIIPSAARDAANFTVGATVFAIASGLLTTDFAGDVASGDWACPVGTATAAGTLVLRIGAPIQKA